MGNFQESSSKHVVIDRNAQLFELIVDYLRGYEILPITKESCPPRMSVQQATTNLLKDAQFYGLEKLMERLYHKPRPPRRQRIKYIWYHDVDGVYQLRPNVNLRDIGKRELDWENDRRIVLKKRQQFRNGSVNSAVGNTNEGDLDGQHYRNVDAVELDGGDGGDRHIGLGNGNANNYPQRVLLRPTPPVMLHAQNVHVSFELFPDDLIINYHVRFLHPYDEQQFQSIKELAPAAIDRRGTVEGTVAMSNIPIEVDGFFCCLADFMEFAAISAWSSKRDRTGMLDWEVERVDGLSRIFGRPQDHYETFIDIIASEIVFTLNVEEQFGGCMKLIRLKGKSIRKTVEEIEFMRYDGNVELLYSDEEEGEDDDEEEEDDEVNDNNNNDNDNESNSDDNIPHTNHNHNTFFFPQLHDPNTNSSNSRQGSLGSDRDRQRQPPDNNQQENFDSQPLLPQRIARVQSVREVFQTQAANNGTAGTVNTSAAAAVDGHDNGGTLEQIQTQPLSARRHGRGFLLDV